MNLAQIAADLRADCLAAPGEEFASPLTHGASVHMRADIIEISDAEMTVEWHFKVERVGKMPLEATKQHAAWIRELSTFRDEKYFNVPAQVEHKMIIGASKYAAAFVWTEIVERPKNILRFRTPENGAAVSPIPQNAREIEAWARTIGPGVRIRGVNVETGEV